MESVATINSLIRTMLAVVIVGGVVFAGWYGYSYVTGQRDDRAEQAVRLAKYERELTEANEQLNRVKSELDAKLVEIEGLHEDIKEKEKEIERLDTALRLIKVTHRVARLSVIDQGPDNDTGELYSTVEFVELDEQGTPIGEPRQFRVKGDVVYIDTWLVKFEDKYIEQADLERSTSLVLFRRLFGEEQEPSEGYSLDAVGEQPQVYSSGGEMSEFEQKIWNDFWNIANNPQTAAELGIRAAHGDAPPIKLKKGLVYKILLRASDGLSIIPDTSAPPPVPTGETG
jgi:hypothetical protein